MSHCRGANAQRGPAIVRSRSRADPEIPLHDDLARRDFRMNMIARALPGGDLVDPYGGEADIRAHRIDILTPATFEEDPLRMLRAAQFAARFSYGLTEKTRAAMRGAAELVTTVAAERIHDELQKLFELAPKPSIGLRILAETGSSSTSGPNCSRELASSRTSGTPMTSGSTT